MPNLQWWQAAVVILGLLGLSPAPWMTGLALGRLQFSAPAERAAQKRVDDVNASWQRSYDELKESRDTYREAWETERDSGKLATNQLAQVATAAGHAAATTVAAVTDAALGSKGGE